MKIQAQGKGLKDEFCTLQFGEVDSDESEQIVWEGGTTHSCQVLTKPGVPITLQSAINLGENVEEFVDYVFDGVLRSTSPLRKGIGKKYVYKLKTDKALAYRFEGGKKKGLKVCSMEAKLRSAGDETEVKNTAGAHETSVSTIEVQHWRKYSEGSQPSAQLDEDAKRAPLYDQFPRWTDLVQSFSDDTPHEYAIDFTGDGKSSKTLKDRLAEERTGYKLFRNFKFHLVSAEEFQKLGSTAPRNLPQVEIPVKENTREKCKEKAGEKDKTVANSVKSKEKEFGESSNAGNPDKSGPEKSSSNVAKPQKTEDNSSSEESTTKEARESIQTIKINSQSTVHTPKPSGQTRNGAGPVAVVGSPAKEDDNDREHEEEPDLEQDHDDDEHTNDHSNILPENLSTIFEQSQDPLGDYYKTVDEVLEQSKTANSSNGGLVDSPDIEMDFVSGIEASNSSVLHGDSDVDLYLPVLPPAFADKKPSALYGMKGGPADQLCRAKDLAAVDEMRSSPEDIFRDRFSTPVQLEPATEDGEISKRMENSLMTPPPSTEKKTVGSIQIPGFPTSLDIQSVRRALSPLSNMQHALFEGTGNRTALKTAPLRASCAFRNSIPGMEGLLPLDLSTPLDSIESHIASSQRGNALLRGRQACRGRSASPAPRCFSPNYRSREWHANNGDAVEEIPNQRLISHFKKLADGIVRPSEEVHVAQAVQPIEEVEESPPAESEQEKKAREIRNLANHIVQKNIQEAEKVQDVVLKIPKEKEHVLALPQTPAQRVAAPAPDTPNPQRTSTPRAATPPTPTPQPRARPSATFKKPQEPAPVAGLASSKKPQATSTIHSVPSKKAVPAAQSSSKKSQPPPVVQPVSSKKPHAATQPPKKPQAIAPPDQQVTEPVVSKNSGAASKKSEGASSKTTQASNPAVQPATSNKRKADAANTNKDIDNRPTKHTSTPASKDKSVLTRRLEEAKARIEAAKKASEKLKEEEDMILEVQKLEEEARQIEQDNALRKSNIERIGDSLK